MSPEFSFCRGRNKKGGALSASPQRWLQPLQNHMDSLLPGEKPRPAPSAGLKRESAETRVCLSALIDPAEPRRSETRARNSQ